MPSHLPNSFSKPFLKVFHILEAILLIAITLATVIAMVNEFIHVFVNRNIQLTDILLMFIYLEILAMVQQFVAHGKIPVRYPLYIAIMAIARYITLGMKELDGPFIIWLSLAAFILAAATVLIRIGHHYWPYDEPEEPGKKQVDD
ncbi:phosphate-starvation-inducible protein PsiE [Photobacterium carnosum]|uniref:phosphate-starvation-inducible protein PsiE n=1 Tax=Photobacterium carnosum TaxID=2023717 RepID=UPI00128C5C74|nr:phosphate-starvation-inducible PsiE family protein [Photobacterium carnosum]KAE8178102.1 phosphate-starvation-inducible E [Photobacterium carnosum]MBY3788855.1 phosphate-starvation-inducible PsiE family protein [Photobacterium carnosum]MCD9493361.1 phosphate-starvation-inducible E [Photobacterium carnosum]MCD9497895.1 phosphate-starvation-inducible E [Photobacterium carnosum]MCD9513507.1 phosphate-starvation-inducible E [Photobacterium carnosum]